MLGVQCCCLAIWFIAAPHGGWLARCVFGYLGLLIATGLFFASRRALRQTLGRPLPRRGPGRWLHTLPIWMMLAVQVLGALLVGLGMWLLYRLMFPALHSGIAVPVIQVVILLNAAAAWQVRRRRHEAIGRAQEITRSAA
jgi:uncharacterized membrane protein YedE/YeeE